MAGCITSEYKTILTDWIHRGFEKAMLEALVESIPLCPSGQPVGVVTEAAEKSKRTMASLWPSAIFYDKEGKAQEYGSPSALYEKLIGGSPSRQVVCEIEGGTEKCSPATMVQSFTLHGYVVRGNGEPPPPFTANMSMADKVSAHNTWKEHLKSEGKHFLVYDPLAPQLNKISESE